MDYEYNKMENEVTYKEYEKELEEKKANKLCIQSVQCVFLPILVYMILVGLFSVLSPMLIFIFVVPGFLEFIVLLGVLAVIADCLSRIAGIILLIRVRVKYPRNKFGIILMWLYIGIAMLLMIQFILYPDFFISFFQGVAETGKDLWKGFMG